MWLIAPTRLGRPSLGMTMECARCHDHKYDPISQKEYYQLYAFFNSTNDIGHAVYGPDQTPGPALLLATKAEEEEIDRLKAEIQRIEDKRGCSFEKKLRHLLKRGQPNRFRLENFRKAIETARVAYYPFDIFRRLGRKPERLPAKKQPLVHRPG